MAAWQGWEVQLLRQLGAPVTSQSVRFLRGWQAAEGGTASYNPMNTTQPASGASDYNSVGVKNYGSVGQGLQATVQTLNNGHYPDIVAALKSGRPMDYARAHGGNISSQLSTWGTGSSWLGNVAKIPVGRVSPNVAGPSAPASPATVVQQQQAMNPALPAMVQAYRSAIASNLLQQSMNDLQGNFNVDPSSIVSMALMRRQIQSAASTFGAQPGQSLVQVASQKMASGNGSSKGISAVQHALSQVGVPYQWGGTAWGKALDCSGLVQQAFARAGVNVSRTTYTQYKQGTPVPRNQLQPGDVVFFEPDARYGGLPAHEGLYIGNNKFVEAPHTGTTVRVSTLSTYPGYMGARRMTGN